MVCLMMVGNAGAQNAGRLGMFEGATDVGPVSHGDVFPVSVSRDGTT